MRRQGFIGVQRKLHAKGIPNFLIYPVTLRLNQGGRTSHSLHPRKRTSSVGIWIWRKGTWRPRWMLGDQTGNCHWARRVAWGPPVREGRGRTRWLWISVFGTLQVQLRTLHLSLTTWHLKECLMRLKTWRTWTAKFTQPTPLTQNV